jgi:hypothetical protein
LFDEYVNHRVCIRGKQAWVGAPTMSTIRCALRSLHILLPQIYRESMCAGLKVHLNGRDSGSTQPYKHKIHSYIQLHFLICSLLNLQCCLMQGCEHLQQALMLNDHRMKILMFFSRVRQRRTMGL